MEYRHIPVLLAEVTQQLSLHPGSIVVDCTLGGAGHAKRLLDLVVPAGLLVGIDQDDAALDAAAVTLRLGQQMPSDSTILLKGNFGDLDELLASANIPYVDGFLFDLGVSSPQLDVPGRGFSYMEDAPLDMRMDPDAGESAAQWIAHASEGELERVLRELGEERFAGRIARAIHAARLRGPILTTRALAVLCEAAVPTREPGKHPATRTFQAIRIHLNRELDELTTCLSQVCDLLAAGGRLAVVSFHSLEDRIVKRFIRDQARGEQFPRGVPVTADRMRPRLRPVGKAIHASPAEVASNPRARSAVLRVAERLP